MASIPSHPAVHGHRGASWKHVPAGTSFKDYLESQPDDFQRSWLGPKRYELYKQGKLRFEQLVNPDSGYTVTIDELNKRNGPDDSGSTGIATGPKVPTGPKDPTTLELEKKLQEQQKKTAEARARREESEKKLKEVQDRIDQLLEKQQQEQLAFEKKKAELEERIKAAEKTAKDYDDGIKKEERKQARDDRKHADKVADDLREKIGNNDKTSQNPDGTTSNGGYNNSNDTFGLFGFGGKNKQPKQIERDNGHSVEDKLVRPEYKPAESLEELIKYCVKKHGITHAVFKEIDLEVANKTIQELEYFEANFEKLYYIKRIEPWDTTGPEKARFDPESMTLYIPKKMTMKDLQKLAEDEYQKGQWSTADPRGLFWHEYAHAKTVELIENNEYFSHTFREIEERLKNTPKKERIKKLSLYGYKNVFECIAESMAEYSSGYTREFAKEITELIIKASEY